MRLGLITTPNKQTQYLLENKEQLAKDLSQKLQKEVTIETKVDPVIGSSEDVEKSQRILKQFKDDNNWDYVFCVSDLPYIENDRSVRFKHQSHIMIIFLPAIGLVNLKKKQKELLFTFLKDDKDPGFESTKNSIGKISLVLGMTLLNKPWKSIANYKTIISVAFATGTYVSIFSMPWELSVIYSNYRLLFLSFFTILGMVIWLIYAHNLWEEKSSVTDNKYRKVYNRSTFFTLLFITIFIYIVNIILLTLSITLFVPSDMFLDSTSAKDTHLIGYYSKLVWLIGSLSILAGAFGSTAEDEDKIRFITYSYRQNYRYRMIQEEQNDRDK